MNKEEKEFQVKLRKKNYYLEFFCVMNASMLIPTLQSITTSTPASIVKGRFPRGRQKFISTQEGHLAIETRTEALIQIFGVWE